MRPHTEKIPKAMIDVAGMPFIHWQLSLLKHQGIKDVYLCIGYLGEIIEEYIGDGSRYNLHVTYAYDGDKLLGTGGAIKKIINILPDAFFITYGDSYLDITYSLVEEAFFGSKKLGLMTVYKNKDLYDVSNVIFQNGKLITYSKIKKDAAMHHIDYGLGILKKEVLNDYPDNDVFDLAVIYEKLANKNQLLGYEVFNRFYEIGSPSGLNELNEKLIKEAGNIE